MPTYAYACTTCEHRFEVQQSFSDAALTECPECQGRLRKLFNSVGIVFKGSGFYRTDSRNGTKTESAAAKESSTPATSDSGSSSSTGASSSGGSDSSSTSSSSSSSSKPATSATASSGSAA